MIPIKNMTLGLDKLTLTVSPFDKQAHANYDKALKGLACQNDDIIFASPDAKAGYRVAVRLKISSLSTTAWPLLQAAPWGKGPYFRLEFNPNRLGEPGVSEMKNIIDTNTPDGWPLFMKCARASRIDANVDVQGLPLEHVLVRTTYPRCTEVWSQKGELESVGVGEPQTIYLGQKGKSKDIYRIYRLSDSKIEPGCSAATRFESVDASTHPLLSELSCYGCPFEKLIVESAFAEMPAGWHSGHWNMFIRFASDHGLNVALKHLTTEERKQAEKSFVLTPIAKLDFAHAWTQWKPLIDTLGLLKPGIHGSYLPGYHMEKVAA